MEEFAVFLSVFGQMLPFHWVPLVRIGMVEGTFEFHWFAKASFAERYLSNRRAAKGNI
jgi:hypothetical protein